MSQVRFSLAALQDLTRLREFLCTRNPVAAQRTAATINKAIQLLSQHPQVGRPTGNMTPELRELAIDLGDSGYIALYRLDVDTITMLAIRDQRELDQ